jgi:hypothetical protein
MLRLCLDIFTYEYQNSAQRRMQQGRNEQVEVMYCCFYIRMPKMRTDLCNKVATYMLRLCLDTFTY